MNLGYFLIPTVIGLMTILQSALNRQIGYQSGLANAVLMNGAIVFFSALLLVLAVRLFPDRFNAIFAGSEPTFIFRWWYLVPGVFGFCVILGLPFAMSRLSALNVVVIFVTAQVVGSLIVDVAMDRVAISASKLVGACLAVVGVLLVSWR